MTEIIERLSFRAGTSYSATEAAIHLNRYLPSRRYCAGANVLDVACGEGYGAFAMAEHWSAAHVDAVDISAEAIAAARENFASARVAYHCAGADDLERTFAPATFDLVVSFETVEHVGDAPAFLRALARLAKPDGTILVSCPNDHWYYPQPDQGNPFHQRKYTFAEFRAVAEHELGPATAWQFGWPLGGFVNASDGVDGVSRPGDGPRTILAGAEIEACTVPTDEALTPSNCSYFLGVWDRAAAAPRPEPPSAVLHPLSMDTFASRWAAENLRTEIGRVKTELWAARHRGELRQQLLLALDDLDAALVRSGLAGAAAPVPVDAEQDDVKLVEAVQARVRCLRELQLGADDLRTKLRNAELHRQAAEIENRLMRERVQGLLAERAAGAGADNSLRARATAAARRQVGRARALAGRVVRRLRGR